MSFEVGDTVLLTGPHWPSDIAGRMFTIEDKDDESAGFYHEDYLWVVDDDPGAAYGARKITKLEAEVFVGNRAEPKFQPGDIVKLTGSGWGSKTLGPRRGQNVAISGINAFWEPGASILWYVQTDPGAKWGGELVESGVVPLVSEEVEDDQEPRYYVFPGGVKVRQISAHLTSFGGQALQYIARSTRLDGQNKGEAIKDLKKARDFIDWEIDRMETAE